MGVDKLMQLRYKYLKYVPLNIAYSLVQTLTMMLLERRCKKLTDRSG